MVTHVRPCICVCICVCMSPVVDTDKKRFHDHGFDAMYMTRSQLLKLCRASKADCTNVTDLDDLRDLAFTIKVTS